MRDQHDLAEIPDLLGAEVVRKNVAYCRRCATLRLGIPGSEWWLPRGALDWVAIRPTCERS